MNRVMTAVWLLALLGWGDLSIVNAQNQPVENQAPEIQYLPAFEAQTRAPSVETQTALTVTVLTDQLVQPWGMTQLPDGRLLVTQKAGSLVIVDVENASVSKAIEGFESVHNQGQGGLLDITLAPDFESSRMIYVTFSQAVEAGNLMAVARGRLSDDEESLFQCQNRPPNLTAANNEPLASCH